MGVSAATSTAEGERIIGTDTGAMHAPPRRLARLWLSRDDERGLAHSTGCVRRDTGAQTLPHPGKGPMESSKTCRVGGGLPSEDWRVLRRLVHVHHHEAMPPVGARLHVGDEESRIQHKLVVPSGQVRPRFLALVRPDRHPHLDQPRLRSRAFLPVLPLRADVEALQIQETHEQTEGCKKHTRGPRLPQRDRDAGGMGEGSVPLSTNSRPSCRRPCPLTAARRCMRRQVYAVRTSRPHTQRWAS